jgi:CRISPR-associated exonuclease Cas4
MFMAQTRNLKAIEPLSPLFTGTQVNYYLVCPRKLWLFSKDLDMEHTSEYVELGRFIHESTFTRHEKEILIDRIKIDFSSGDGIIHEVKKSDAVEEAHVFQVLYYLYYLKRAKGLSGLRGRIHYPKLRQTQEIELTPEREAELESILEKIEEILSHEQPPPRLEKLSFCKKCSYYELCYT